MSRLVKTKNENGISVITVDNPPVNALAQGVRRELLKAVRDSENDSEVSAVVLHCHGRTFIAGADINEFTSPKGVLDPDPNEIFSTIEGMSKPMVAAIHGTALGAGLELALACHYRCAAATAKVGLPEVKLGLLPGSGGTQRLPRLIGVKDALGIIIKGGPISARAARDLGIMDKFVEGDLPKEAVAFAGDLVAGGAPLPRVRDIMIDPARLPDKFFEEYGRALAEKNRGNFAPERIIRCVEAAVNLPFEEGLRLERELFLECLKSPQSAALRHLFFAEREAARVPDVTSNTPRRNIKTVAVIGAGTMGGGIAMAFAEAGFRVTLLEVTGEALQQGIDNIRKNYEAAVRKGRLSKARVAERMDLISGALHYADLAEADLVIEAVFEDLELKKEIFRKLDTICRKDSILATNTSALDVNLIARATGRPESVIGLHFFSPANVMRLLEVVRGAETAVDVVGTAMKLAKAIGKVGVLSGVCYGFIGNRMLEGYIREVGFLLLEGAEPEQIDRVLSSFGFAMGPCAMLDLVGLEVRARVVEEAKNRGLLPTDERYELLTNILVKQGRYGIKTGAGFYTYQAGSRSPVPDPAVKTMIAAEAGRLKIEPHKISDKEILGRCLYPLINEGAQILEDGIALRAGDLDLVWIHGFGFPAFRGGPMHFADSMGLDKVYRGILNYRQRFGEKYWTPAPLLKRLVQEGKLFSA